MIYQTIIMPGITRVKKNSRRLFARGKYITNLPSKAYEEWAENVKKNILIGKLSEPLKFPVFAHFLIVRPDKRKFDLSNMIEGAQDLMQAALIIPDDDYKTLIPVFHSGYSGVEIDKQSPRLVITLTDESF